MVVLKRHYKEGVLVKLSDDFKKSEMKVNIRRYVIELEKSSNEEQTRKA